MSAASEGLFRAEVAQAMQPRAYGEVVLDPGVGSGRLALAAVALVAALAVWLAVGSLTRRTTVSGHLEPEGGLRRIVAPQAGVVLSAPLADGQTVRRGQTLFVLSGERQRADGADLQADALRQIRLRRDSTAAERQRLRAEAERLEQQLHRQRAALRDDQERLQRQQALQAAQVDTAREALARYQGLLAQGYASRDELLPRQGEWAQARERQAALAREGAALARAAVAAEREADDARSRLAARGAELLRADALLAQELAEADVRREWVVTAPMDGRLALAQVATGQSVEPGQLLAQVVPEAAVLQARLFAPSHAAGFVRPGTPVLLRYDAYPYQKFGQHGGVVVAVADAAVDGASVPGLAPPVARAGPPQPPGPVFPVTVRLHAQAVDALGQPWPLRAGMTVQAELLHESRRLHEWVLEPLYAWRARLAGPPPAAVAPPVPAAAPSAGRQP